MTTCSLFGLGFFAGSPGPMELIVIFLVVLVLFGPRRLPDIAKMIGKTLHELRRASEDFKDQVMAIETDSDAAETVPAPMEEVGEDVSPEDADHVFSEDDIIDEHTDDMTEPADEPAEPADETSEERHDLAG